MFNTFEFGVNSFCPPIEGKQFENKERWLEAHRKDNPAKKKRSDNVITEANTDKYCY